MSLSSKNKYIVRAVLPISMLDDHPDNPNSMGERAFDLLVENMDEAGFTDPIYCWPRGQQEVFEQVLKDAKSAGIKITSDEIVPEFIDMLKTAKIRFTILGGHHRKDALVYLQQDTVFTTITFDPDMDDDAAEAQLVRNNIISGKLDPNKFTKLVERQLKKGLDEQTIQAMYGFAEEAQFKKLVDSMAKQLPEAAQEKFKQAAAEIKTVDGLSKLLNKMFTMYGDTLPYGYMIVDYGGQKRVWLRVTKPTFDAISLIGEACLENNKTVDAVLGHILTAVAKGEAVELVEAALEKAPSVKMPLGFAGGLPTEDKLDKIEALSDGDEG